MRSTRTVQFALAERISHLDTAAWNALTQDSSVFLKAPFLTALERALPENVSPRYALMYQGDEAIAAVCMQVVALDGRATVASTTPLSGLTQLMHQRALVLGSFAGWGDTGLVMKEGADATLVWTEALRLMDRLRRFEKLEGHVNVSFVKDAAREDHEAALRKNGYQRAPSGPDMLLEVDPKWRTLDDYLACLASKRRRAVKKTLEDLPGYQLRRLTLAELRAQEARLDALYGQVWASAEIRPLRLSGKFFVELQQQLGEDCVVMGLEKEGRLEGFGVCLRSGTTCVGYYLGYDKSVEAPLYFRLLVSILEQGLAWQCARVSMGRTTEEPKARLGAAPGGTALWVKHRTPPLNWAVGAVLGSIEVPEVETFRVFKQEG